MDTVFLHVAGRGMLLRYVLAGHGCVVSNAARLIRIAQSLMMPSPVVSNGSLTSRVMVAIVDAQGSGTRLCRLTFER